MVLYQAKQERQSHPSANCKGLTWEVWDSAVTEMRNLHFLTEGSQGTVQLPVLGGQFPPSFRAWHREPSAIPAGRCSFNRCSFNRCSFNASTQLPSPCSHSPMPSLAGHSPPVPGCCGASCTQPVQPATPRASLRNGNPWKS